MSINDSTKTALVRKGNELFNKRDIEGAYRCYLTASYFAGIEKIADYYNFEKKNAIKAIQLYKFILKEDSNLGGNVRAKAKLDALAESVVKVLRKWLESDETYTESKREKTVNTGLDAIKNFNNKNNIETTNSKEKFYSQSPVNIKKPVFEKIDTKKNN